MKRKSHNNRAILFAILLLLLVTLHTSVVSAPAPLLFFTNNIDTTNSNPGLTENELALLGLINNAVDSIDLAIYDFNRESIRDALISAHQRGVTVRVVTDDEVRHDNDGYMLYYQALENAGIAIVDDDRSGSIMHN